MANGKPIIPSPYPIIPSPLQVRGIPNLSQVGTAQLPPTYLSTRAGIPSYTQLPQRVGESVMPSAVLTPQQRAARATANLAKLTQSRGGGSDVMPVTQQRQRGFFDSLPSPMSPAGQALGAFGSTALQLSGYQDRPITLGAGLGAAMQAAQKAYTAAEEKEAATALAKQQRDIEAANRAQDLAIKMLEIQATQAKAEREQKGKTFTEEKALRDTLDKRSKEFDEALMGFQKVQRAALAEPSGANDIALIFGFMKTIDPTSVVREGEFATAEQAGGVSSQVLNLYNRAVSGERLPDNVRKKFVDAAREQFAPALERQRGLEQGFTDLAESYKLDPTKIVLSRIPKQGSMTMPYSVATEAEAEELPSGSYVYINGRLARID